MKVTYLGGPMRGLPNLNFPAFDKAAAELRSQGWTVYSPAEKDRDVLNVELCPTGSDAELRAQGFSLAGALAWDFTHIIDATTVIFLPGWRHSNGCLWEMAVAHATGKDIWEYGGIVSNPGYTGLSLLRIAVPDVVTDPRACARILPKGSHCPPSNAP